MIINSNPHSVVNVHNASMGCFLTVTERGQFEPTKIKREDSSGAFDMEERGFEIKPADVEIRSGYAVAVGYDENNDAIVAVKTYGVVDMARIQELEVLFPKAKIRHLGNDSSVAVVKKNKYIRK